MPVTMASWIVGALGVYAGIGILFAIPFVVVGVGRIDALARSGSVGFRILMLPGAAALWPFLLVRWIRGDGKPPEERTAHRRAGKVAATRAPVPSAGRAPVSAAAPAPVARGTNRT